jgi:hypothetical protein
MAGRQLFSFLPTGDPTGSPYPWKDTLLGLGIGLLGGKNWGEGAASGLQYANQLASQRRGEKRQDTQDQREAERFKFETDEAKRKQAEAESMKSGYQGWIGTMFDADPSNDIPGMTQQQAMFLRNLPPEQGYQAASPFIFPPKAKDNWEIKTVREGNQEVTYRINPATGEREKLGAGAAFAPQRPEGSNLSVAAPVWGLDKAGNPVLLQMSPSGTAFQTVLPEGVTPVRPNISVDTGTGTAMVSPITGAAQNVVPKDVAGKAAAEEIGTATGKVAAGLPDAIAKAEEASALINSLKTDPGRLQATGTSSYIPALAGTAAKDFNVKLDQLKGTVFLQAYSQLKGGGAITEVEGKKAEQAIARLDTAQSEGEFVKALDELDSVIKAGISRMKQRAGAPVATPEDADGWQEIDGVKIRVKP